MQLLDTPQVKSLARIVEESTRSTREGVKYFIEPAPGTLARAKNKRHHIVFGRRGSGKSSLLAKVTEDLTVNRTPIAYVDLEEFKGHSYPDVLLSVLIKTLQAFKTWLQSAAIHPATKSSFWEKYFGSKPKRGGFNRANTKALVDQIAQLTEELNQHLFSGEETKQQVSRKIGKEQKMETALSTSVSGGGAKIAGSLNKSAVQNDEKQITTEYTSRKIELLHRNIMRYKAISSK